MFYLSTVLNKSGKEVLLVTNEYLDLIFLIPEHFSNVLFYDFCDHVLKQRDMSSLAL